MDSFELNKIIAAILMTALIVIGIGKLTDAIFYTEKLEVSAYKVEGLEASTDQEAKSELAVVDKVDINQLLAMGDIVHGEKVFKKCSACHIVAKGGKNLIGPALYGVVGKASGSAEGYKYSAALIKHDKNWNFEELNGFLLKPRAYLKGTKMAFAGLRKDKDRASVILYLNSKSDSPLATP
jgi:cytochrome c